MSMDCPHCGKALPDRATFCAFCGWKVAGDTLDRTVTNLAKVGREAFETSIRLADRTAKAIEPAAEKAARAITAAAKRVEKEASPAARRAGRAAQRAAEKGVVAGQRVVEKTSEAVEKAARTVKEKSRKRPG